MLNASASTIEIEFVKSLPGTANRGRPEKRRPFVDALKSRRGEWAIYPMGRHSTDNSRKATAYCLRRDFPGVETAVRSGKIYARWMGKAGAR